MKMIAANGQPPWVSRWSSPCAHGNLGNSATAKPTDPARLQGPARASPILITVKHACADRAENHQSIHDFVPITQATQRRHEGLVGYNDDSRST